MMKITLFLVSLLLVIVVGVLLLGNHSLLQKKDQGALSSVSNHSSLFVSNQWYTSLYRDFPTQPLFALPLAFRLGPEGLGFSYPQVTKSPNTIAAPYIEDFHVGFSDSLITPKVISTGDWNVTVSDKTDTGKTMDFTLAHGVPSTTITVQGSSLIFTPQDAFSILNNGTQKTKIGTTLLTTDFLLSIRGHNYLIAFPSKQSVSIQQNTITIQSPSKVYIALLDKQSNYSLFLKASSTEILGTQAQYHVSGNTIQTTYSLRTVDSTSPLIALYPHQYDFLASKLPTFGSYQTIRGTLNLVQTNQFQTAIPLYTPQATYPALKKVPADLTQTVKADTNKLLTELFPTSKDYGLGVWFGKAATLLQLTSVTNLPDERQKILAYVEPKFIQSLNYFHYDENLHSLVANYPEFGNQDLNDHHFHYGYYIRTAAVLAQYDPTIIPKIQEKIDAMVGDIATTNRQSTTYPYLRNFDTYEGHSWASGFAGFADGNNQESSSEAINAWYGIYLWGSVTKNTNLGNMALALYSTEIESTKYYWFGQNGLYTAPYQHSIASIVWGGKVDFATWFSAQTNNIYGIQLLPFTPGSFYLGTLKNFNQYDSDFTNHAGSIKQDWGDLYLMWKSFYDPKKAMSEINQVSSFEAGNTKSNFLYVLYYNIQNAK